MVDIGKSIEMSDIGELSCDPAKINELPVVNDFLAEDGELNLISDIGARTSSDLVDRPVQQIESQILNRIAPSVASMLAVPLDEASKRSSHAPSAWPHGSTTQIPSRNRECDSPRDRAR